MTAAKKLLFFGTVATVGLGFACVKQPTITEPVTQQAPPPEPTEEMKGHDMSQMETLPVEKRVAFMSGHVFAGLALYRAGAPEQAAPHLLHPVSETHQAERAGIDALGFKADIFKAVSDALAEKRAAEEIEPMLKQAEENIVLLQTNAGGDAAEVIEYLMNTIDEEYAIGVKEGKITDPGEYQDAYGFSVVALQIAKRIEGKDTTQLISALEQLVGMWPENGPLADSTPSSVATVTEKTAQVVASLQAKEAVIDTPTPAP